MPAIGRGELGCDRLHVMFVAREPRGSRKVVGVYAAAEIDFELEYPRASTAHGIFIPPGSRPILRTWPGDQGGRRWAKRPDQRGVAHASLMRWFSRYVEHPIGSVPTAPKSSEDQTYVDMEALEGETRLRLVRHRAREGQLREAKIRSALRSRGAEGLTCEVPGCGFNFAKQYGHLGSGYAQVHHTKPLSKAAPEGRRVKLSELAIVCANCHVMIHAGGECRELNQIGPRITYAED